MATVDRQAAVFRIWIAQYERWRPRGWWEVPPEALAMELAEAACFSAADAQAYLQGYNATALARGDRRWAVALPVVISVAGEPRAGDRIFPRRSALTPAPEHAAQ